MVNRMFSSYIILDGQHKIIDIFGLNVIVMITFQGTVSPAERLWMTYNLILLPANQ